MTVVDYLRSISDSNRFFAYLRLDDNHRVLDSRGSLDGYGFEPFDLDEPIDAQIDMLSGILPVTGKPIVIQNAHLNDGAFIDIHVFFDGSFQWVLFLDNAKAGAKLQAEQQSRLIDDIHKELKKSHGS